MIDPFGAPSQNVNFGASPQGPPQNSGDSMLAQLGIPPHVVAMWRQKMSTLPPQAHAQFLEQNLRAIPGVTEKLQQLQAPLNANVQQVEGAPGTGPAMSGGTPTVSLDPLMVSSGGVPAGGGGRNSGGVYQEGQAPTGDLAAARSGQPGKVGGQDIGGDPNGAPGENPKRFQGRLKHGKGLPPGQLKKQPAATLPPVTAAPLPVRGGGGGTGRFNPAANGGTVSAAPMPAPRQPITGGGLNDYRRRRLGMGGMGGAGVAEVPFRSIATSDQIRY